LHRTVLIIALVAALGFIGALQLPRTGGRYWLSESDHADVMTSGTTPRTARHIAILFVGNSFTFVNDLPAMVVNLAAADAGNTAELEVKAITVTDARLDYLLQQSGALAWLHAHPVDYTVLQEHSGWYEVPDWIDNARNSATAWRDALIPLHAKPVLFETWADGVGSTIYAEPYYASGKTPAEVAHDSELKSADLAQELGIPMVMVGRAFDHASRITDAPDLFGPDRHHPAPPAPISPPWCSIGTSPVAPAPKASTVPGA
jgi:hypothetical protein